MAGETAEIYRVNKLLEIEQADWERQLKQAVSEPRGFCYSFQFKHPPSLPLANIWPSLSQGFKDSSISIFEASCILHKYERRTELTITRAELDSGALRENLEPSDYDTSCLVSLCTYSHLL